MTPTDITCSEFIQFTRDFFQDGKDQLVPLHAPTFGGREYEYIREALDSTFVSTAGLHVDRFAQEIRDYVGVPFVIPVVSGTAGLHLALLGVGVSPGSVVLTPALSFVATSNAIRYCQADPIFLDVEVDSLGLDPVGLEFYLNQYCERRNDGGTWIKTCNKRVSACLPVHVFGNPCKTHAIKIICDNWGIPLVEDSAESFGSLEDNIHSGTIGNVGVYSFNGNKIITTGAGGAVITKDEQLAGKISHLANVSKVSIPTSFEFIHDGLGFNYKMPALNAALGLAQLESIDKKIAAKKVIHEAYREWFEPTDVEFLIPRPATVPNHWLNAVRFESPDQRTTWLSLTNKSGISTRPLWRPLNQYPQFEQCECMPIPQTEVLSKLIMNLPSSPNV